MLKGAALAYLVYPQSGLRPMRNVDVLVSRSQARQAQALLAEMGFKAPPPGDDLPTKRLTVAQREEEGLPVSVQIPALWWGRWLRHPLHILGWVRHYFINRARHN